MRPVLFLDVDGVLNSRVHAKDCLCKDSGFGIGLVHLTQLVRILRETGASVVVSSTWRKLGNRLRDELARHGDAGAFVSSRIIGRTVDGYAVGLERHEGRVLRGTEIQAWLDEHPDVESFVILDDDSDMGHLMHRLVHTTFHEGLTAERADKAISMLREKSQ